MASAKVLKDNLRAEYVAKVLAVFEGEGEDVGMVASNELNLPVVDAEGNEFELVIKVSLKEEDMVDVRREAYEAKVAEAERKAKEKAEAKAKKMEADAARRKANEEAKARAKAKKENA